MDNPEVDEAGVPFCQAADPDPRPPGFKMPARACDTHMHIFGPAARYRFGADRSYTPPEAPLSQYEALAGVLGIRRVVIVQPSVYGTDNRCTMDAVRQSRLEARAVVVVAADISDTELDELHAAGARGIRVNMLFRGGVDFGTAERLAGRIARLGWHLQVLIDVARTPELVPRLGKLGIPVVFDHMGHLSTDAGLGDPGFQAMLELVREGVAWVKLSGAYRLTSEQAPPYADVAPFARALVEANAARCLWATDWPHPAVTIPMPEDGTLLDMFAGWVPDADIRRQILVDNPVRLYGFFLVDP